MAVPRATVGAVVFNKDNNILLLRSPKWNNKYIVPCGHIEFGEKIKDAVIREVKEETGLSVYGIKFIRYDELINSEEYHRKDHFVSLNFMCRTNESDVKLNHESNKHIWTSLEEAISQDLDTLTRKSIEELHKKDLASSCKGKHARRKGINNPERICIADLSEICTKRYKWENRDCCSYPKNNS